MNKAELEKDIHDIDELDGRIWTISNGMSKKQRASDNPPDGECWLFKQSHEKYKEWFDITFPHLEERKRTYWWINNHGVKENSSVLHAKMYTIRRLLVREDYDKNQALYVEMDAIKDKYEKYFQNVMCDMPHDGASDMTDFLRVVVNIMGDLE